MIGLDWKDIELDWIKTSIDATKKKGRRKKKGKGKKTPKNTMLCVVLVYAKCHIRIPNAETPSPPPVRPVLELVVSLCKSWEESADEEVC